MFIVHRGVSLRMRVWQPIFPLQKCAFIATRPVNNGESFPAVAEKGRIPARKFAEAFPDLIKEWHPTRNPEINPETLSRTSVKQVWWKCEKGHEWLGSVRSRTMSKESSLCPICAGRLATPETSFKALYPELMKEWHPTKNVNHNPEELLPTSRARVWWQCKMNPKHEWQTPLCDRTVNKFGCAKCSGRQVSEEYNLATSAPEIAAEWHPYLNGSLRPWDVAPGTKATKETSLATVLPELVPYYLPELNDGIKAEDVLASVHSKLLRYWKNPADPDGPPLHTTIKKALIAVRAASAVTKKQ